MNDMGKSWVVMGRFKLKDWYVKTDVTETTVLSHKVCDTDTNVDYKHLPEILDVIAEHECPSD